MLILINEIFTTIPGNATIPYLMGAYYAEQRCPDIKNIESNARRS